MCTKSVFARYDMNPTVFLKSTIIINYFGNNWKMVTRNKEIKIMYSCFVSLVKYQKVKLRSFVTAATLCGYNIVSVWSIPEEFSMPN